MDIQQWEKESLAAYVYQFKTEAKQFNFMSSAGTIRIFIKGLKNAQSLAERIYEKDLHTLADAITEVEKLSAAQQLTMIIIPSSMVNLMSHEEDGCFQCQEAGHIAHHCPHIICPEYSHIIMDCPHRIPPSEALVPHHKAYRNCHNRSSSRTPGRPRKKRLFQITV